MTNLHGLLLPPTHGSLAFTLHWTIGSNTASEMITMKVHDTVGRVSLQDMVYPITIEMN